MAQLGLAERAANLQNMAEQHLDILVIGGGITGCGVALDAASRGYKVGLIERDDFASGTSSKSTKLVHGGIRYLPQYDFALVREALVERGLLTRNAPFLVRPIGFLLPLYKNAQRPLGMPFVLPGRIGMGLLLQTGLFLYDLLSGRLGIKRHRRIGVEKALRVVPHLKREGLKDAYVYYDAQTDDTRLTLTVLRTAAENGACVANYAEAIGFQLDGEHVTGAKVRDNLSGEELTIKAHYIINATGVFSEKVEAMAGGTPSLKVAPAKGAHITVSREAIGLKRQTAVVLPETDDGRILFLVPWGPRVTIGTTDTAGGDVEYPVATEDDVEYLLRHVNRYMDCNLTKKDILSTWAGYRPLVQASGNNAKTAQLSRTHAVIKGSSGMITIIGGKLTTYRRMAQDTLDEIDKEEGKPSKHYTTHLTLQGGENWITTRAELPALASRFNLAPDVVRRLETYGDKLNVILDLIKKDATLGERLVKDLPYLKAEVIFACRYEMAAELDDVLVRRLHINFEDKDRGATVAPA
ncbi:MAG: glycerol-3-phosphate dehydrogenase/oxidase, partial [Chloroflexia bacterium]